MAESTIAHSSTLSDTGDSGVRSSDSGLSPVVSLLDRLKRPKSPELARKRKVDVNPPPKGKHTCHGTCVLGNSTSNPKNVSPAQQVKEHPNEALKVSAGRLFCDTCHEELSLKSSSINSHSRQSTSSRRRNVSLLRYVSMTLHVL